MHYKRFLILILFLYNINISLFAQKPAWINSKYRQENFDSKNFYVGFYESKFINEKESKDEFNRRIKNAAIQDLIESIFVKIESETALFTESNNNLLFQNIKTNLRTTSNIELFGLKVEFYFNQKTKQGYVFTNLDKNACLEYYKLQITTNLKKVFNLKSDIAVNNDNINILLNNANQILKLANQNRNNLFYISLINASIFNNLNNENENNIKFANEEINSIQKRINLIPTTNVVIPDFINFINIPANFNIQIDNKICKEILPFKLKVNEKNSVEFNSTNEGILSINIIDLNSENNKFYIQLELNIEKILDSPFQKYNLPIFDFNLKNISKNIFLNFNKCNLNFSNNIENWFKLKNLTIATNKENIDYQLNCNCLYENIDNEGVFQTIANINIELIDINQNKNLFTRNIETLKSFGKTEDQSFKNLISISTQETIKALTKIKN